MYLFHYHLLFRSIWFSLPLTKYRFHHQQWPNNSKCPCVALPSKTLSELSWYQEDIDFLSNSAGLNDAKKIKAALCYAALDEAEVWKTLPEVSTNLADWKVFIKAIKKKYLGWEGTNCYCCADIQYLVQEYHGKQIHNQDDLGEYIRMFHKISAILIANKKLAEMKHDMLYLNGFLSALQQKIQECLLIVKQDLHSNNLYPMEEVTTAPKFLLTRSTFQSLLPPAFNMSH